MLNSRQHNSFSILNTRIDRKVTHNFFFCVGIATGMLKFHRYIVWSFHYRHISFMCSPSERSVNYATNMARMLLSSTYEVQRCVGLMRLLWAKGHNVSKIHRDMCEVYSKTKAVATSPGSTQSQRRYFVEECAPPGDVATIHTVFLIHATHVPVNFTPAMPFIPQKSYYTSLHFTRWLQ